MFQSSHQDSEYTSQDSIRVFVHLVFQQLFCVCRFLPLITFIFQSLGGRRWSSLHMGQFLPCQEGLPWSEVPVFPVYRDFQ